MSAKIISIFSNKGGVGKTFVSVNLASSLSLSGKKTLVIDLDCQGAQDMARMINVKPKTAIADLFTILQNEQGENVVVQHATKHSCGLHFYPLVQNTGQIASVTPDNLRLVFDATVKVYDYIIVDTGSSFTENVISAFDYSNLILLVGTPDILSVEQIKWGLKTLQSLQYPTQIVKLILNRSQSSGSFAWQDIRSAIPCEIFGHIPSDGKTVGMSLNRGIPCVLDNPKAKVSEAFNSMAEVLKQGGCFFSVSTESKDRKNLGRAKAGEFWEKYGITQQIGQNFSADPFEAKQEEVLNLKARIHQKLVDRMNLDGITRETLTDRESVLAIKKKANEVVGNLLMEESSGNVIQTQEERAAIIHDIVNEALGLGPLEDFLADPDITDIMANSKDAIYIEKKGKLILSNKRFISDEKMRAIIDRIIAPLGRRIDESTPMVDARLPDGSRINAIIPPLALNGAMITIRKFGAEKISINDLVKNFDSLTPNIAQFLKASVVSRKNILVSGGTGAGKTTLLNVISEFIPNEERIITIEDAAELQLQKDHWARLESRPKNIEGKGEVTIRDLFTNCLRMRPDRIVIGECRGPEVLDMLQAMNTGHDGSLTTLHANSTRDVLIRLHAMILLSGIELPVRAINEMISTAIHLLVHISRFSDGTRKITGVSEIKGLSEDFHVELEDIFIFKQAGVNAEGKVLGSYQATGYIPACYDEFISRGLDFDKNIFTPPSDSVNT